MLDLEKEDTFEATHDSGVTFTLRPVDPRTFEKLQRRAGKSKTSDADPIAFAMAFADHAIVGWQNVKQGCTEDNKKRFGERFAFSVMPWMVVQCMDVARSLDGEIGEAKNA